MSIRAEEPNLRAAHNAGNALPDHVANRHEGDQSEEVEECAVRVWRRYWQRTAFDLNHSHRDHDDEYGDACEDEPDRGSLSPRRATHYLSATADADARPFRNERVAVRADKFFHAKNVAVGSCGWEDFLTISQAQ